MARDLTAFVRIANVINSTRDRTALQQELLGLICEVIPASQAAIVLQQNANEEPSPPCTWNREGLAKQKMLIREELVQRATWERCAVFNAARADVPSPEHVLCVPLVAVEKILGVIYLSSPISSPVFNEDHASFLSSISRIAAVTLENLSRLDSLRAENQRLRAEVKSESTLIGESKPMVRVAEFITRVAKGDSTVLIRGESGTGKELVARAIHVNSSRSDKPFVAINCAAIPDTLLESELFGYEKGAFTGAARRTAGKLESADGGTVFLDEIGEMPASLQAKLLRVVQERTVERIGGRTLLSLDLRIVCATNRKLDTLIGNGGFRDDLFYRISEVIVRVPPLRDRQGDSLLLAQSLLQQISVRLGKPTRGLAPDAIRAIQAHRWPGNVRELENRIKGAVIMAESAVVTAADLGLEDLGDDPEYLNLRVARQRAEAQAVRQSLAVARGNLSRAAELLGVTRPTLYDLLAKHSIEAAQFGRHAQEAVENPPPAVKAGENTERSG
jgi:transcriptional regulator with PAS, ATPase and Fis domain